MGGEDRLRVEVLGPVRASSGAGRDVTPEGSLQRRLLALLVLHRGRVVSADTAIDALWPGRPPKDPLGALQTHMSRLRRGLPAGFVESTTEGYCIAPARLDVDADRLADAVHRALDTEDVDALATIDTILERWRGPAYPELADVDAARAESVALAELRTRAAEARAQRRLTTGVTTGLIADLAALVDEEPLRERPRELLMAALAAAGRHAEALRVYDDFRRLLSEELGISPSPSLSPETLGVAGRRRCLAMEAGAPAPARSHFAGGPHGDDRGDSGARRDSAPADVERAGRRGQVAAPPRNRPAAAGGPPRSPGGDVRAGGGQ